MADGGFLVKFDGKEVVRCYAISFDYDKRECVINEKERRGLPVEVRTITIDIVKQDLD